MIPRLPGVGVLAQGRVMWRFSIFLATVFLSAFLLFLVQSVMGKHLLPWFGGTPSVWATCMLFFQTVLLLGYAYAWAMDRWVAPGRQRWVHLLVVAAAIGALGWGWVAGGTLLLPGEQWKPEGGESPVALILGALGVAVGLPYFVLSSTAPLVMRWFTLAAPGRPPWRLYAVSNAGSLLGLVGFPFLFEPRWPLPVLAAGWSGLFVLFALGLAGCALAVPAMTAAPGGAEASTDGDAEAPAPGLVRWMWVLLAAVTSALFLATTNQLCQEVALVPLLWVMPLAVYLVTFILCFESPRWYGRRWMLAAAAVSTLVALVCAFVGLRLSIPIQIAAHGTLLFFFCMVGHGELARLKPAPRHLSGFYLLVALGGALGGAAVSLGAPLLLTRVSEFHITLLAGWVVVTWVLSRDRESVLFTGDRQYFYLLVFLAVVLLGHALGVRFGLGGYPRGWWRLLVAAAAATALAAWVLRHRPVPSRPLWPRVLVALILLAAELFMLDRLRSAGNSEVASGRNFYGAVRVDKVEQNNVKLVRLTHGQINHGFQYLDETLYRQPAGYCNPDSGAGLAFTRHPRRNHDGKSGEAKPMRIGVAGLGVGAMAAYGRAGDVFRFYEINPLVIQYAVGPKPYFSYIADTPATVETVLADARLALERERRAGDLQQFDLLLLDAFSSDSVPVHLLTLEAFQCYVAHLRDAQSLIAVNISNRFIDFRPLVFSIADRLGLQARVFYNPGNPPVPTASLWMLVGARGNPLLRIDVPLDVDETPPPEEDRVLWTDSYSNIFSLLKWSQKRRRHFFLVPAPAG
jgi:hypothetical protein